MNAILQLCDCGYDLRNESKYRAQSRGAIACFKELALISTACIS
jgi:hypothetical protein